MPSSRFSSAYDCASIVVVVVSSNTRVYGAVPSVMFTEAFATLISISNAGRGFTIIL